MRTSMLAVMACLLGWTCQVRAEEGPPLFRVRIEGGSATAVSAPSSVDLTTGWKRPCVLELENRDAVRREVALAAVMPVRVALNAVRIVLEPNQTRAIPFLLQTLSLDEREACLTVGSGAQGCSLRIRVKPRPDPAGVRFGALEHFDVEGPIGTAAVASSKPPKPQPVGSGKPQEGGEKATRQKDLSHLVVAPTGAVAERVLEAMRPIQDLGCQTYRMDVNWRTIEQKPGVFSWDRADWMINAIRSPKGGGSRLVAQIGYQPQWLPRDFPKTDEGRQAYSRWTEEVVSRYADRVDTWEIWNEPLLFWLPCPTHKPDKQGGPPQKPLSMEETDALAASYADMILEVIRAASKVIRQRDPQATILSPGFEDFLNPIMGPHFGDFSRKVYARLLSGGMAKYVDGFCIHSYPLGFPAKAPPLGDPRPWRKFDQAADTGKLAQWLKENNVRLPLYCTEFGGFRLPQEATADDETSAALALIRNGCILAHQGFRLVTYFELYDWGASTCLLRYQDQHHTRGYSAYQRLIVALTGATACEVKQIPQARIYDSDSSGLVIKAFRRGSEDILCLWNNAATPRALRLHVSPPSPGEAPIFEHVRFAPPGEFLTEKTWGPGDAAARDVELTVAPLEFHILSRTSSSHGFDWLARADVPAPKDLHE